MAERGPLESDAGGSSPPSRTVNFCVVVHMPRLLAQAVVGPFTSEEAAKAWADEKVGEDVSATIGVLWDPESAPRFG
jgi:hypothetical protein